MITLIITVASIVAYCAIGWWLAARNLPRAWVKARDQWSASDNVRGSVKGQTIAMLPAWPYYAAFITVNTKLNVFIDTADPEVAAAKIRDQQRRITELERDLGIR